MKRKHFTAALFFVGLLIMISNIHAAEKAGVDFDQEIVSIQALASRPPKQLMFIPALLLFALVWVLQRGRARKAAAA